MRKLKIPKKQRYVQFNVKMTPQERHQRKTNGFTVNHANF